MATEMAQPRVQTILEALSAALGQQGAERVEQLDLGFVASAIDAALPAGPGESAHPLDPEGDGLEPSEINAANDI